MLPFDVTIPATVLQTSEIPEGLMNCPVFFRSKLTDLHCVRIFLFPALVSTCLSLRVRAI